MTTTTNNLNSTNQYMKKTALSSRMNERKKMPNFQNLELRPLPTESRERPTFFSNKFDMNLRAGQTTTSLPLHTLKNAINTQENQQQQYDQTTTFRNLPSLY